MQGLAGYARLLLCRVYRGLGTSIQCFVRNGGSDYQERSWFKGVRDGEADGSIDGCMDGCIDGSIDGCIDGWIGASVEMPVAGPTLYLGPSRKAGGGAMGPAARD